MSVEDLAINGGPPTRAHPFPPRRLFGERELAGVIRVFEDAWASGVDFGYQGKFEKLYTDAFSQFQGGGFTDAVSSGTAAVYLALMALDLPPGSDVVVSPVTDPGCVAAVVMAGLRPVVADAEPGSFNVGASSFADALTPRTRAAVLTHLGGQPIDLAGVVETASRRGIRLIEDCSQAHGALYRGQRVGTFGDLAAFSTMFSKNHATGGCGGLVYTRDGALYWRVRALADRGKAFDAPGFNPRSPDGFAFAALNFNQDELSCAIGLSTLARLPETIERRNAICDNIDAALRESAQAVLPVARVTDGVPSPFFHTVRVDESRLRVSKPELARALAAEGIPINSDYRYLVADWRWLRPHLGCVTETPHARRFRDSTINILFHERFDDRDVDDIIGAIMKVESAFRVDS